MAAVSKHGAAKGAGMDGQAKAENSYLRPTDSTKNAHPSDTDHREPARQNIRAFLFVP